MSEEVMTEDPDTGALKGVKLERYDLIPTVPLDMLARHYGVCTVKYPERQWEKGYEWWKSFGAACRHLFAFWRGEDIDEETGSPHLVCTIWHCMALLEFSRTHPEKDTRVKV